MDQEYNALKVDLDCLVDAECQLQQYQSDVSKLVAKIEKLKEEKDSLQILIMKKTGVSIDHENEIKTLKTELELTTHELKKALSQNVELKDGMTKTLRENDTLKAQLKATNEVSHSNMVLSKARRDIQSENEALRNKYELLKREHQIVQRKYNELRDTGTTSFALATPSIASNEAHLRHSARSSMEYAQEKSNGEEQRSPIGNSNESPNDRMESERRLSYEDLERFSRSIPKKANSRSISQLHAEGSTKNSMWQAVQAPRNKSKVFQIASRMASKVQHQGIDSSKPVRAHQQMPESGYSSSTPKVGTRQSHGVSTNRGNSSRIQNEASRQQSSSERQPDQSMFNRIIEL